MSCRQGRAGRGRARGGFAGREWLGADGQGLVSQVWSGEARRGRGRFRRCGMARRGKGWSGFAGVEWLGVARAGFAGREWLGGDGQGLVSQVWRGRARCGMELQAKYENYNCSNRCGALRVVVDHHPGSVLSGDEETEMNSKQPRRDWAVYALILLLFGSIILSLSVNVSLIRRVELMERKLQGIGELFNWEGK